MAVYDVVDKTRGCCQFIVKERKEYELEALIKNMKLKCYGGRPTFHCDRLGFINKWTKNRL